MGAYKPTYLHTHERSHIPHTHTQAPMSTCLRAHDYGVMILAFLSPRKLSIHEGSLQTRKVPQGRDCAPYGQTSTASAMESVQEGPWSPHPHWTSHRVFCEQGLVYLHVQASYCLLQPVRSLAKMKKHREVFVTRCQSQSKNIKWKFPGRIAHRSE